MIDNFGKKRDVDVELKAHAAFHTVINGEVYIEISSFACIDFLRIRSRSNLETLGFLFSVKELGASNLEPFAGGLECVENSAIVVAHDHDHYSLVHKLFGEQGLCEADLEAKVNRRLSWYGIVDGNYWYQETTVLMNIKESTKVLRLPVTVVPSGLSMKRYP